MSAKLRKFACAGAKAPDLQNRLQDLEHGTAHYHDTHPAGVSGVEYLRLISAFVGPNRPVCEATFTKMSAMYPRRLTTRSVRGGGAVQPMSPCASHFIAAR